MDGYLHHSDFEIFKQFDRIVVTGPQRSGTKLVANAICLATNYKLVIHHKMPPDRVGIRRLRKNKDIVLHHPSYVALLPRIADPTTAVVFVWRDLNEIHTSEKRYKWKHHGEERKLLKITKGDPAWHKQLFWEKNKHKFPNTFDVKYEDMKTHPFFVSAEDRKKFKNINQVTKDGYVYKMPGISYL